MNLVDVSIRERTKHKKTEQIIGNHCGYETQQNADLKSATIIKKIVVTPRSEFESESIA